MHLAPPFKPFEPNYTSIIIFVKGNFESGNFALLGIQSIVY